MFAPDRTHQSMAIIEFARVVSVALRSSAKLAKCANHWIVFVVAIRNDHPVQSRMFGVADIALQFSKNSPFFLC